MTDSPNIIRIRQLLCDVCCSWLQR